MPQALHLEQEGLDQPSFIREGDMPGITNDHMVQNLDSENIAGFMQAPGECSVLGTRRGIATRMIMKKDDSSG